VRLKPTFRFALYGAFAFLFVTGVGWLAADRLKESSELWQEIAADLLMLHGGAAMAALMMLGALFPLHVQRGWRAQKNRAAGAVMLIGNALLIVTAFGLYYAGSDTLRPWMSDAHTGVGLVLPALLAVHIALGRLGV
jgi:hypothetical protein